MTCPPENTLQITLRDLLRRKFYFCNYPRALTDRSRYALLSSNESNTVYSAPSEWIPAAYTSDYAEAAHHRFHMSR